MQIIYVNKNSHCSTIGQALEIGKDREELTIVLGKGVFREKIVAVKKKLILIGAGKEETVISWSDSATNIHEDGFPVGTFRSQTAYFDGEYLEISDLTIANEAGVSSEVGQAVAVAIYATKAWVKHVKFLSYQDTLFLGPLPKKERQKNGFIGGKLTGRDISCRHYFQNCHIAGDVDFIFGGADAIFEQCTIQGRGQNRGYIAAPCTFEKGLGFVFLHCNIISDKEDNLLLARPWRGYARVFFYCCNMKNAVQRKGYHNWAEQEKTYIFSEYPYPQGREYSVELQQNEIESILNQSQRIIETIKNY